MEPVKKDRAIWVKVTLPVVLGALAGYVYYYNWGCKANSCMVMSSEWMGVLYGSLLGAIFIPTKALKVLLNSTKGKKNG
jgi:hypothetical protein